MIRHIAATAVLVLSCSLTAPAIPHRPQPERLVNDFAGIFTPGQQAALERVLVAFDDSTSNQIAVVTVDDLEGYEAAEYATRTGLEWKVGSSGFDNGIVVLVKPKKGGSSGEVFIAVGYGLEGAIPDVYAKRIIDADMIPRFRENDYFGGVVAGCSTLMKLASGEISSPREEDGDMIPAIIGIIMLSVFIAVVLIAADNKGGKGNGNGGRRTFTGPIIISGRGSGGFGNSTGGRSFGGFGGGSFGGGGAGGKW